MLANFGLYYEGSRPWIHHDELGWLYVSEVGGEDNATWMWSTDLGWFWTGDEYYPHVYLQEFEDWSFVGQKFPNEGKFFNYSTGLYEAIWPEAPLYDTPKHQIRRLQVFLNVAGNSASAAAIIDGFKGLSREVRDVIISELLFVGSSTTLTGMGISLGF